MLLLLWLWLSLGQRLGHRFWQDQLPATQLACALALGTVVTAAAGLLLGLASCLGKAQLWLSLGLGLLLSARPDRDLAWLRQCGPGLGPAGTRMLLGLSLLAALVPNTHYDAQVYHYTLPRLYLENHAFYWTATGVTDGIFHLYHLIVVWPLALGGEVCANLLGPLFLFILAQALAACLDQEPLVYWLVFSSPAFYLQSCGGLPELAAAAFVALSLLGWKSGQSALSALWMGAALSTRLSAAPALLALMLVEVTRTRRARAALRPLLVAGLFCLPWMAFNCYHTGYPLYPLGARWKTSALITSRSLPSQSAPASSLPAASLPTTSSEPAATTLSYPWVLFAVPAGSHSRAWQDCLSPLLLGGLLLCILGRRPSGISLPVLLCLAAQIVLAQPNPRFNLPGSAGLLVLAAAGWAPVWRSGPAWQRGLLGLVLAAGLLPGIGYTLPRLAVLLGRQTRQAYLRERLPVYEAYQWLASTSYRKVLLIDPRAFRCPKQFFLYLQADLLAASQPDGEESFIGLHRALRAQDCDLVIWNLDNPSVRELTHNGDFEASNEDAQLWLKRQPDQFDYRSWRYRVLFQALHGGRVVYRQGTVVAVEWPASDRKSASK
ncbi:MAG: hypothetical protein U0931_38610 [Vulcanimicrobiota bacterium]